MKDADFPLDAIQSLARARGLHHLDWHLNAPGPGGWEAVHALLVAAFAYMDGRIDPPSSLHAMDVAAIRAKAAEETVVVVTEGARTIACGFCTPREGALYIGKLAVDAAWRRRGLLGCMVDIAEELARSMGLPFLDLEVRVELVENQRAFEALGFRQVRAQCHPGYDHPTNLLMRRPVQPPHSRRSA